MLLDAVVAMAMNVFEYWIVSAPGDKTCQQTWDRLNQVRAKEKCDV